jgi:hypothetical protein
MCCRIESDVDFAGMLLAVKASKTECLKSQAYIYSPSATSLRFIRSMLLEQKDLMDVYYLLDGTAFSDSGSNDGLNLYRE